MNRATTCPSLLAAAGRLALLVAFLGWTPGAYADCGTSGHTSGRDPTSLSRAQAVLESNGIAVGTEYEATRFVPYTSGAGMIEVRRLYRDLPIFRDALAFHFDSQGRVRRDRAGQPFLGGEGEDLSGLDLDPSPGIDSGTAKEIFAQRALVVDLTDHQGRPSGTARGPDYRERLDELDTHLGIYQGALAWEICPPRGPAGYISAEDGTVLYFHSGVVASVRPARRHPVG